MNLADLKSAIADAGLTFSGAFHPHTDDLPAGHVADSLIMLGFTSREWPVFAASREYSDGRPHPLDRWSYRVIGDLAASFGARAYFPFTAPPMPFIKWAKKAEPVHQSAMGMMIHPEFGLWRAWRGALAFGEKLDIPPRDDALSPCDNCADKPCLSACPVGAMKGGGVFEVAACGGHIRLSDDNACMAGGCLARRACPIGKEYQYTPEHAAFHMKSFRGG